MCPSACLNKDIWVREWECHYRQMLGSFFSSCINFSPCVPSLQFLGRKETELTMQTSPCSVSSYKLKNLTTLNCRHTPLILSSTVALGRPVWRCSSLKRLCSSKTEAFVAKCRSALASSVGCGFQVHLWIWISRYGIDFKEKKWDIEEKKESDSKSSCWWEKGETGLLTSSLVWPWEGKHMAWDWWKLESNEANNTWQSNVLLSCKW